MCTNGHDNCFLCDQAPIWTKRPIRANTGPPRWRIVADSTWCTYGTKDHWIRDYHFLEDYADGQQLLPEIWDRWNSRNISAHLLRNHYMTIYYRDLTSGSETETHAYRRHR